jgi:hypothetical protein
MKLFFLLRFIGVSFMAAQVGDAKAQRNLYSDAPSGKIAP